MAEKKCWFIIPLSFTTSHFVVQCLFRSKKLRKLDQNTGSVEKILHNQINVWRFSLIAHFVYRITQVTWSHLGLPNPNFSISFAIWFHLRLSTPNFTAKISISFILTFKLTEHTSVDRFNHSKLEQFKKKSIIFHFPHKVGQNTGFETNTKNYF